MTILWLLMALTPPTSCLLTSDPGPAHKASPFQNLHVDPIQRTVSWERRSPGPNAFCEKLQLHTQAIDRTQETGENHCPFPSVSRCHPTNYSVYLNEKAEEAAWVVFPEPDPNSQAAATDLQCSVHHVTKMSCHWGRGLGAPSDVQYRMFWRNTELPLKDYGLECQNYVIIHGTRLGCHIDNVTALPLTVTVTGSSSTIAVPCSDVPLDLKLIEVLTPPTMKAECNGTAAANLHWHVNSLFTRRFLYDLQINKSNLKTEESNISGNYYRVVNPGAAFFRIRVKNGRKISNWSEPKRLDCSPRRNHVTVTVLSLLAVGAGLTVLGTLLLCQRRALMKKLFPPIPQMKDPTADRAEPGELVTWTLVPEECEVTQVTEA